MLDKSKPALNISSSGLGEWHKVTFYTDADSSHATNHVCHIKGKVTNLTIAKFPPQKDTLNISTLIAEILNEVYNVGYRKATLHAVGDGGGTITSDTLYKAKQQILVLLKDTIEEAIGEDEPEKEMITGLRIDGALAGNQLRADIRNNINKELQ